MKISVSLPEQDLALLDSVVEDRIAPNRSAAIQLAIDAYRMSRLASEYRLAAEEWESSPEAKAWRQVSADGLNSETW